MYLSVVASYLENDFISLLQVGDRSEKTCRHLWEAIPQYRTGHCYTDFWSAYQAVIPEEQHSAVGKETGETVRTGALE
jgi:IS1 family transposase